MIRMRRIYTKVSGYEAAAWESENDDWEKMMTEAVCKTHQSYRDKKLCKQNVLNKLCPVSKRTRLISIVQSNYLSHNS